MATTEIEELRTPDAGDPYALTQDLLAFAQTVEDSFVRARKGRYGTSAERDEVYGVPASEAERVALANRQVHFFNSELGWAESYYVPSTAIGLTARGLVSGAAAGWYPVGTGPAISLLPAAPQNMSTGQVFSNWGTPGVGLSWRRGGSAYFDHGADRITVTKAGRYRILCNLSTVSGAGSLAAYVTRNGATIGPDVLTQATVSLVIGLGSMISMEVASIQLAAGDTLRWYAANIESAGIAPGANGGDRGSGEFAVQYLGPAFGSD